MEGSNGGSNLPAPFLLKTYEMVDDHFTNSIVSWSDNGLSFVVWNPPEFARDLLPNYFKHNNFSSFIRQLNTYGFRKIDPEQWEFANEEFIRGQMHLLKNIHRRKPVHSHSGQGNVVPLADLEREEFIQRIEKLKQEKLLLQSEVERQNHESRGYESQLRSLGERFQGIDQRQQQLMFIFSQLLQKPSSITDLSKSPTKKRGLSALHFLQDQGSLGESLSSTTSLPSLNMEHVENLDLSLTFWEKFMDKIGTLPSTVITEMTASWGDSEMAAISSVCVTSGKKPSGIDVNRSPIKILDTEMLEDQEQGDTNPSALDGANDVFWQQFLMEAPGSTVTQ